MSLILQAKRYQTHRYITTACKIIPTTTAKAPDSVVMLTLCVLQGAYCYRPNLIQCA